MLREIVIWAAKLSLVIIAHTRYKVQRNFLFRVHITDYPSGLKGLNIFYFLIDITLDNYYFNVKLYI